MKKLITAEVTSIGGRVGSVKSSDGIINTKLENPIGKQKPEKLPNPELFFAAAYSACFHGALQNAAKKAGQAIEGSQLTAVVTLNENDQEGYELEIELKASLPGVDREKAEKILQEAHKTCPYSKLVRGESRVKLTLL